MSEKVLFVDDDPKVLKGVSRQFEDVLDFETAQGPDAALEMMQLGTPFAAVVADMRMPGMNGIELLSRVRQGWPDTVRIMLTGYADLQATIDAVNEGNIFRFLSKPCPPEVLEKAVRDGLAQYRLVTAERELLEGTLHGSIKVLCEMLSLVNPLAFGRTSQVQRISLGIGEAMQASILWDLKIATMLFPLGCVTVSEKAMECVLAGDPIPESEEHAYAQHAAVARNMLVKIPRLEKVAEIVAYQEKGFDGSGRPHDDRCGTDIPLGARILKAAADFETAYKQTGDTTIALKQLLNSPQLYDPQVLHALQDALRNGLCQSSRHQVPIEQLAVGMVLAADVRTAAGQLMVTSGQEVTESILRRLRGLCDRHSIGHEFEIEILGEFATCQPGPPTP